MLVTESLVLRVLLCLGYTLEDLSLDILLSDDECLCVCVCVFVCVCVCVRERESESGVLIPRAVRHVPACHGPTRCLRGFSFSAAALISLIDWNTRQCVSGPIRGLSLRNMHSDS